MDKMSRRSLRLTLAILVIFDCVANIPVGATIRYYNILKNITGARDHCQQDGGHLLTMKTRAKLDFLEDLVEEGHLGIHGDAWIDLYNTNKTHSLFAWVSDGEPLGSFKNWYEGEPNSVEHDRCVRVVFASTPWKWRTRGCSVLHNFICEMPSGANSSAIPDESKNSTESTTTANGASTTVDTSTVETAPFNASLFGNMMRSNVSNTDKQGNVSFMVTDDTKTKRMCGCRRVNFDIKPKSNKRIREELLVDTKLLTRVRMRKISVDDRRASVQTTGYVTLVVMATIWIAIIGSDIIKIFQNIRGFFN